MYSRYHLVFDVYTSSQQATIIASPGYRLDSVTAYKTYVLQCAALKMNSRLSYLLSRTNRKLS